MNLNEVEIEVKHSGLLEVPAGKEVDQLPQEHFQKLIDKKGYEAVIRGLTNLEVWNKNKNPKLSQWASSMADKLKKANNKDESYSQRFQQALDEINAKAAAKVGTKAWNATKKSFKKLAKGSGEALKRAGTTAQNAIVAGAAAPIGVKIANTYNKPKKKEQKYSASDVAAIAAALKKNEDLNEDFLFDKIKSNLADFAKAESDAYLKAKAIINKAQQEQLSASNANAVKHPILSAIKDGVRIFGHVFIAILLGLTFIALYSKHTGSAKQLFKMVIENVSANIINDALILIGFTAGFRKFQQIFSKEKTVTERLQIKASLIEAKIEKKKNHLKDAAKTVAASTAAGAGVGGGLGAGMLGGIAHKAATTLGATQRRGAGKFIRRAATGLGGAIGGTYGAATGAAKGLVGGAVLAAGKYAYDKHKEHKAKMKSKSESLKEGIERLDAFLEFARKKSDNPSHYSKLPESPAKKTQKRILKNAERVSGNTPAVDPAVVAKRKAAAQKGAQTKAANAAARQKATQNAINKPLIDAATKSNAKTTAEKVAKATGERAAKAKEIFKGSEAMKKALKHKAFVGGLKGAAIATGLGAAAYGVHKYRNRDNY